MQLLKEYKRNFTFAAPVALDQVLPLIWCGDYHLLETSTISVLLLTFYTRVRAQVITAMHYK